MELQRCDGVPVPVAAATYGYDTGVGMPDARSTLTTAAPTRTWESAFHPVADAWGGTSSRGIERTRYTSKERDAESGLDYFGARYMSSAQGRFTSPDPLLNSGRPWEPQSWNRYSYTLNNPLRYTDPAGLYEWDASLGGNYADDELKKHYGKAEAQTILALRKDVRSAISRLDKSKDSILQNAGSAYGTEGKANGVTIAVGPVSPGAAAQAEGDQGDVTVRVPGGRTGDSLFIDLAHEGTHVFNSQQSDASVMFPEGGILSFTRYDTEMNGYLASSAAAHSIGGQGTSGATVNGNRYVLWDPAWTKVDLQTQPRQNIDRLLHASPLYNNPNGNPPKRLDDVVYGK